MAEGLDIPEEGKDCDRRPCGRGHRRRGLAVFSPGRDRSAIAVSNSTSSGGNCSAKRMRRKPSKTSTRTSPWPASRSTTSTRHVCRRRIQRSTKNWARWRNTAFASVSPVQSQGHGPSRPAPGGDPGGFCGRLSATGAFINALERDPLFFIIDSVELGGEQAGVVRLQLKLETYQKASG